MSESLADFFRTNFHGYYNERAYGQRRGYRMQWFTYGQVLQMALQLCLRLETRGIAKGDRVMLWGENCAEWVAAFFGCALCGAIVVPMDNAATADFASRVSTQVDAKLWISSRQHAQECASNSTAPTLVLEDLSKIITHDFPPTPVNVTKNAAITGDDVLQIVFTSGTTAEPKGVVITHANVLANIAPLRQEMQRFLKYERWVHPVRFLNLLPLSHVFGQFLGMFLPPLLGGIVLFQEELKPSEIISTIRRERVSVLVGVPGVLQSLKQKIERDLEDAGKLKDFRGRIRTSEKKHFLHRWWTFRAIRRRFGWKFWAFISGGAALDADTEEFWNRLGYAAIQGYGLTETTSLISVNHPFKLGKGSIGKVLPGRELKLAEDGEILIRGGGVAAGYWQGNRDQQRVDRVADGVTDGLTDNEGWYRTGDVGALDEAGNLYFKGRKKEVIVTPAGLNIYPEDLEAALRRQPEVRDCVVVGIEREGNAEPCAVLLLHTNFLRNGHGKGGIDAAVDRANQSLAEFQRMRMYVEWPERDFPRTSTQKPQRRPIAEFAENRFLRAGSEKVAGASPLSELIGRITRRNVTRLSADATLDADLGLSSLDRVELISVLEDRYQLDLSETRFSAARTVADLERMLRGEVRQPAKYHYPAWVLRWPVTWLRWLAHYFLMRPAMLLLGWPKIEGRHNLRGCNGPLLVVCNHISDVDVGFVQTSLPARLRNRIATATGGEALEALRTPPSDKGFFRRIYHHTQWLLGVSLLNLFPLPREAGFRQSFAYAGQAVDRGYSVLVFPEGRHTEDGNVLPFRAGIGLLTNNLGIPVLPMRIVGLFEVIQAGKKFAPPGTIRVRIGKPLTFAPGTDSGQIARELQSAVEAL